jgi:hypothetical protein
VEDPEQIARASLRRSLIIYAALLFAAVVVVTYIAGNLAGGFGYVTLSVVVLVGLLIAYQVLQYIRDLNAPLAESDGVILRKWKRADLIIALQSFYITVDRAVFRITAEDYVLVDEGMYVKVVHFPNTLTVVSLHEMMRPPEKEA